MYNKTTLLPNLDALNELLINGDSDNPSLYNCKCIYGDRIAIKHIVDKDTHKIRIWKTKSLFDYWYNDFHYCHRNFIAALEYTIHDAYVKIDYLYVNDSENIINTKLYNNSLDTYESEDLVKSLIGLVENIAKKENKHKIIKDVHTNLRIFQKYYYYNGFNVTNKICTDNPFWVETEILI
jgi:hypothetical protein